jgi:hypothetical protein
VRLEPTRDAPPPPDTLLLPALPPPPKPALPQPPEPAAWTLRTSPGVTASVAVTVVPRPSGSASKEQLPPPAPPVTVAWRLVTHPGR